MAKVKGMTGQRFGKLAVIEFAGMNHEGSAMWKCICDCGKDTVVRGYTLRRGDTQSCGCFIGEAASVRNATHRMTKTRLYVCWKSMKSRCYYENDVAFERYGGRGIKVSKEWRDDFLAFREWALKNGYEDNLTLDRIDSNGNYEPNNCRWLTLAAQQSNRSDTIHLEFNGKNQTLTEWAHEIGISVAQLSKRLKNGMSIEDAITTQIRGTRIELYGEIHTLKEWSQITGIPYNTLKTRYHKGWSPQKILSSPTVR